MYLLKIGHYLSTCIYLKRITNYKTDPRMKTIASSDEPLCYPAFATQQEKAGSDACRIAETEMRLGHRYFRSWAKPRRFLWTGSTQYTLTIYNSVAVLLPFSSSSSSCPPSRYINGPSILLDHSLSLCLPPGNLRYSYRTL